MAEEKEKPLTREDVLRLIKENGGTAEGLDLSGKKFEEGIKLRKLDLGKIILEGANLPGAHLEGADLFKVHLEGADLFKVHLERASLVGAFLQKANLAGAYLMEADLSAAHLEEAQLWSANLEAASLYRASLEGANLWLTYLRGAHLWETRLSSDTKLQDVRWGDYTLAEERGAYLNAAVDTYRRLKTWYLNAGMSEVAAEFYYREMEAKRKDSGQRIWGLLKDLRVPSLGHLRAVRWGLFRLISKHFTNLLRLWIYRVVCGYGEKPYRVVAAAASLVFGLAAAYYFWGSFSSSSFWDTLYYSAASFTALGYGKWAPQPTGWAKGMGAAEAFIGVFMMALFLITFVRKMTR